MALDLMEEFRAPLADRLALTLINRKQISADDFDKEESGAVFLKEDSRKKVLNAWQERKKTVLVHPFLQEKTTQGLLIHIICAETWTAILRLLASKTLLSHVYSHYL